MIASAMFDVVSVGVILLRAVFIFPSDSSFKINSGVSLIRIKVFLLPRFLLTISTALSNLVVKPDLVCMLADTSRIITVLSALIFPSLLRYGVAMAKDKNNNTNN